ncbi:MAG: P22 phage major capsid protein family protein, partial [Geminicoccaceae bacterium]
KIDRDMTSLYDDVWNWVGTPGQTVNSFADFALAPQRLDEGAVPTDRRKSVLSPNDHWGMAGSQTGLFFDRIGQPAYRRGSIGTVGGVETFMDQNIRTHTTGTFTTGSTPLVNGASQNVAYLSHTTATYSQNLITDGWANSTLVLTAGDVITLAGVNAVNPVPGQTGTGKDDLGRLQQFVVLDDVTSDGSGNATITISPPIITSGPQQTCTAAPANNAAITPLGTEATGYTQNLAFHRNAFALVTVPLEMPDGVSFKARETHEGISMRVVKDYDIINDDDIIRLDVLYGVKSIYPDLATRLSGTA